MKNLSDINVFKSYQDKVSIRNRIIGDKDSVFSHAQFDLNSILFRHKEITPFSNEMTMLYELHRDLSTKIHIPLTTVDDFDDEYAINKISKYLSAGIDKDARCKVIDGAIAVGYILAIMKRHVDLLKEYNIQISDLVLQLECEDIENTILYFNCPLYFEYIKENGLCFSQRQSVKTRTIYLKDCEGLEYKQLDQTVAFDLFCYVFGFHPDRAFEIHREALRFKYPDLFKENLM